jgi:hypothetical protein
VVTNHERKEGRGKRKRRKGEGTVVIAGRVEVPTVDKVMVRDGVRKEGMMGEVGEGTIAAGRLSDHRLTRLTLPTERPPFDIEATALIITGATVGQTMTTPPQTRVPTATARHTCTTGNHRLRSLR